MFIERNQIRNGMLRARKLTHLGAFWFSQRNFNCIFSGCRFGHVIPLANIVGRLQYFGKGAELQMCNRKRKNPLTSL